MDIITAYATRFTQGLMQAPLLYCTAILLTYLLGSIPSGLIIGRVMGIGDIRSVGSGNIGATNMVRAGGKKLGALTLMADMLKGVAAIALSAYFLEQAALLQSPPIAAMHTAYLFGVIATIGHCYPVWLRFNGGKGVATAFGVIIAAHLIFSSSAAWWLLTLTALWIGLYKTTKTVSIASLAVFIALPLFTYMLYGLWFLPLLLTLLIILRHKDNIRRLLHGSEHAFTRK